MEEKRNQKNDISLGGIVLRILASMLVLAIAAFFTPYFSIRGITPLLIAAIFIGAIDYLIERFTGFDATPFGRGLTGFIVSALIIYVTGLVIRGVTVSLMGAILAALAIGIINAILPGRSVM